MNFVKTHFHIFIFIILILLVFLAQVLLLKPIIGQGLTFEDYVGLYSIRVSKDIMFSDPVGYWIRTGIHDAAHNMYVGFQDILFGENYTLYLYINIFFKIIATLLLYPLILLITKNRLLAFLTTLLYAISYSSAGALYLYVVGNEYLGVALVNLFFITYYLCIKKLSIRMLLITSLLMILSFLVTPIRIFPLFLIIILVEIFIVKRVRFSNSFPSFLRLAAIFLPIILIMLFSLKNSGTGAYDFENIPAFIKRIVDGNWYLLLYPLWGFGYTYLPVAYFHIFGNLNISSFSSFLTSLSNAIFFIFFPISLFLSLILTKKFLNFFLTLISINFFLDTVFFIFYTHHFGIPEKLVHGYSGPSFNAGLYAGILAIFIISIAITCGIEWYLTKKRNNLLFFIFVSPFLSLIFIGGQWLFTRDYYMYQEGIHRYFVIPAIGSYLFIAGIMVAVFGRIKISNRIFSSLIVIYVFYQIFNISKGEISQVFNGKKGSGRDLQIQRSLQTQALSYISKDRLEKDMLFFIRFKSDKLADANRWEDTFDWRNLTFWMPIKRSYILNKPFEGCTAMTVDYSELQKMAVIEKGFQGFLYKTGGNKESRCAYNGSNYLLDEYFIKSDDFYAFRIDELKVINITEEVKKDLFSKL